MIPVAVYGQGEFEGATFHRVCPKCGRFVKAGRCKLNGQGQPVGENARCRKCGRVQMPFLGYP